MKAEKTYWFSGFLEKAGEDVRAIYAAAGADPSKARKTEIEARARVLASFQSHAIALKDGQNILLPRKNNIV